MKYTIHVKIEVVETDTTEPGDIVTNAMLAYAESKAQFEPLSDFKTHALNDQIRGVAGNACGVALDRLRKELEDEPS